MIKKIKIKIYWFLYNYMTKKAYKNFHKWGFRLYDEYIAKSHFYFRKYFKLKFGVDFDK